MPVDIIIPLDLWTEDEEGVVTTWMVPNGAVVKKDDLLAEVMVIKTQHEIRAPANGVLTIVKDANAIVSRGAIIGEIH